MKIICIGRNYAAHARELNNEVPDKPVIFLKPDTAILRDNKPFYIPEWAKDVHYETEVVYKIGKNGKYVDEAHAHKYISEIGLGIDFTDRGAQAELKSKGLPWELAKGFDNSAVIGAFFKVADMAKTDNLEFYLEKNGEKVQHGHTSLMLFPIHKIIAFVSQYYTLKTGDLIFTGTPEGVGQVKIGDQLTGYLEGKEMFSFKVK